MYSNVLDQTAPAYNEFSRMTYIKDMYTQVMGCEFQSYVAQILEAMELKFKMLWIVHLAVITTPTRLARMLISDEAIFCVYFKRLHGRSCIGFKIDF